MEERYIENVSFSLDQERFNKIWSEKNWFKLRQEFKTNKIELSQSLLIWDESGVSWLITDFENQQSYLVESEQNSEDNSVIQVSELSDEDEHLRSTQSICSCLQQNPQTGQMSEGTHYGLIALLQMLDLEEIDVEGLKRSNLSGSGLSFEDVHQDLLVVYDMFREILTLPREKLINLPFVHIENVKPYLPQFYEIAQKIEEFDISVENPTETHADLLKEVSDFCNNAKNFLSQAIAHLKSTQFEQLENQVKTTLTDAVERVNTTIRDEVVKLQKIGEEVKQQEAEVLQKSEEKLKEIEQTHLKYQNQLTEKPISQYKEIFTDQAEKHRNSARFWMWMAIVATTVFFLAFILLSVFLKSGGTQIAGILQNLFTKGFILSPIYVWLNRSIKNHTAQKHLEVINIHRQNALETYDAFVDAAEGNRETRDAVLLAATKAIFDANQSGYLSAKSSGSDTASPVQQIIKEVLPSKSSTDSN